MLPGGPHHLEADAPSGTITSRAPLTAPAPDRFRGKPHSQEASIRLVFEPEERDSLRADARNLALTYSEVAYVLERLASEGVDLEACTDWEDLRLVVGLPPRAGDTPSVA